MKNKIPVVTDLVKETNYDPKILKIEGKYINTSDSNKFTSNILDAKVKQKELDNKSDISNLIKNSDLNTLAAKTELKAEKHEIVKIQAFDSSYFHSKFVW